VKIADAVDSRGGGGDCGTKYYLPSHRTRQIPLTEHYNNNDIYAHTPHFAM